MARAWDMPPNTFGAAYAKFMGNRNFSPDDRPPVRFMETEDLAYIATRSREVHDFWHVLFNLPTSVMGELALKMVEFHQTGIPMTFLSVAGASWRLKPKQRNYLFTHYAPWALRAGTSATDLMCVYYEEYLDLDLEEVRSKWGIIPAPPLPKR
jgi:ubiquinone biosynthesis protein COQ4